MVKKFKEFINENESYEDEFSKETVKKNIEKSFHINIEPISIDINTSNSEELDVSIVMNNGDKLEYRSYYSMSPDNEENDTANLSINGRDFKLNDDEFNQSIEGAKLAYKRYLSKSN